MDFHHHSVDNAFQTARLVIEADFDPQFTIRVLHRFAERGTLPLHFVATAIGVESLRIEVEFKGPIDSARLLSKRLLNLPSARSFDLSIRRESPFASNIRKAA